MAFKVCSGARRPYYGASKSRRKVLAIRVKIPNILPPKALKIAVFDKCTVV